MVGTAGELMWLQCRVCLGTQDRFSVTSLFSGRWKKDQENPIVKQESGCGFRKALGTDGQIDSLEAELGGDLTWEIAMSRAASLGQFVHFRNGYSPGSAPGCCEDITATAEMGKVLVSPRWQNQNGDKYRVPCDHKTH